MGQRRFSFFTELKRRKVVRAVSVYAAVGYAVAEVADLVFPRLGLPDWAVTGVIVLGLLGLPVAAIFAWVFDLSGEGITRTADASLAPVQGSSGWLSFKAVALVILLVALGAGAGWWAGHSSAPETDSEVLDSIAVLPFTDMSADGDMEYFGDGMAEEILNVLAKQPGLKVAGRTSSFSFKDKEIDLKSIGQALEVATLLEGSVRRSGERIRITAQLIRADDQFHLWSETFDRQFDEDVFTVQDDIARAIVDALQVELGGTAPPSMARQRGTTNLDAYNAYLLGRFQWNRRTREGVLGSIDAFKQAIALDPEYAKAYSGLADAYLISWNFGWMKPREGYPLARQAVDRALQIDPLLADAHTSLAAIQAWYEWDFVAAEQSFNRAIELDPGNAFAHYWLGTILDYMNRPDEALRQIELALQLDPLALQIRNGLSNHLQWLGELDAAIASYQETLRIDPAFHNARRWLALAFLEAGRPQEALEALAVIPEGFADSANAIHALAAIRMGDPDTARAFLNAPDAVLTVDLVYAASAYAALGDMDHAFRLLQKAVAERQYSVLQLGLTRSSDPLRSDPRFREILSEINLAPYWE